MARKKAFPFYSTRPVTMTTPTVFFRWQRARPGGGRSASSRDLLQYWLMASPSLFLCWPWPPLSLSLMSPRLIMASAIEFQANAFSLQQGLVSPLCVYTYWTHLCAGRVFGIRLIRQTATIDTHTQKSSLYTLRERENRLIVHLLSTLPNET